MPFEEKVLIFALSTMALIVPVQSSLLCENNGVFLVRFLRYGYIQPT